MSKTVPFALGLKELVLVYAQVFSGRAEFILCTRHSQKREALTREPTKHSSVLVGIEHFGVGMPRCSVGGLD